MSVTTRTTVITPFTPIALSESTLTCAPSSATPIRINFLLASAVPAAAKVGQDAKLAITKPKATHRASGLIAG